MCFFTQYLTFLYVELDPIDYVFGGVCVCVSVCVCGRCHADDGSASHSFHLVPRCK